MQVLPSRCVRLGTRLSKSVDKKRQNVKLEEVKGIGKLIATGGSNFIFEYGDKKILRLSLQPKTESKLELDLMEWSSQNNGVRLHQWGTVAMSFNQFIELMQKLDWPKLPQEWPFKDPKNITIAQWNNTFTTHRFFYTVMEKWDGSLFEFLIETGKYTWKGIDDSLMKGLLAKIQFLHSRLKIIHFDLFPKNIFYKKDRNGIINELAIADFGGARFINEIESPSSEYNKYFVDQLRLGENTGNMVKLFKRNAVAALKENENQIEAWATSDFKNYDLAIFYRYFIDTGKLGEYLKFWIPKTVKVMSGKDEITSLQNISPLENVRKYIPSISKVVKNDWFYITNTDPPTKISLNSTKEFNIGLVIQNTDDTYFIKIGIPKK